eukprot:1237831-Karenia_brevis.AAC.1
MFAKPVLFVVPLPLSSSQLCRPAHSSQTKVGHRLHPNAGHASHALSDSTPSHLGASHKAQQSR